ncbi:MAG: hypothetical protein OEL76_04545 [Siculibacillus sp.]|nr:hypothetical protein [Siculibacillus sp.]
MPDDPFSAGVEQFSRAMALPWRLLPRPTGDAFLAAFRHRNALLDALFYDVHLVTAEEAEALAPSKAREGTILIVPPTGAGSLKVCSTVESWLDAGGDAISTLTVAGVGSSALGTAAFARNVADAVGAPVAAVVSGYGLADLVTEATGGFLWFAGLTTLHDLWERLDRSLDRIRDAATDPLAAGSDPIVAERDSDVVRALLCERRAKFDLIVAHSKGNMVVGEALHALQREDRVRADLIGETVHIVSISSRLQMPRSCRQVTEIVGRWDLIGSFATRRDGPPDVVVPDAWHHTNTELYGHLPVTKVLKEVLAHDPPPLATK